MEFTQEVITGLKEGHIEVKKCDNCGCRFLFDHRTLDSYMKTVQRGTGSTYTTWTETCSTCHADITVFVSVTCDSYHE